MYSMDQIHVQGKTFLQFDRTLNESQMVSRSSLLFEMCSLPSSLPPPSFPLSPLPPPPSIPLFFTCIYLLPLPLSDRCVGVQRHCHRLHIPCSTVKT